MLDLIVKTVKEFDSRLWESSNSKNDLSLENYGIEAWRFDGGAFMVTDFDANRGEATWYIGCSESKGINIWWPTPRKSRNF